MQRCCRQVRTASRRFAMTVADFCKWIESSGFKDGDRLPSVRDVASSSGASTYTVFRAYKSLVALGKVYAERGNGYFWGRKPELAVSVHERESDRLERLLLEDWKSGKISAGSPLPSIKDLCTEFGTTPATMRRTLEVLQGKGILERKGRGRYWFANARRMSAARFTCFREGLNVMEYFISSHGARKGLADTALKTADAGYLTRRLVDVGQDLVITEEDCGTTDGIEVSAFKDGDDTVIALEERLLGRAPVDDIKHPVTGEVIVKAGELVTERDLPKISATGLEHIKMRSVLTCNSKNGVCSKCYGRMLASGRPVDLGEAVGVLAAQSIGEPGTQLTLRTFHIGGASSRLTVENNKKALVDGRVELEQVETVDHDGNKVVTSRMAELVIFDNTGINKGRYQIPYGAIMHVENNATVKTGDVMFEWDPYTSPIITNVAGKVKLVDLVENKTFRIEKDENTDVETWIVISEKHGSSGKQLRPAIAVLDAAGNKIGNSMLPDGAILTVKDGDMVTVGSTVAKLPRAAGKTRDITGGLPRVAELFEARKPKNTAVLAPMDGLVVMGNEVRGNQEVIIKLDDQEAKVLVPRGVHLAVNEGDRVRAGQKISEGSADPHDILAILGPEEVQRHLVNEIQAVYRLQGVSIADKHIECIVRQMMRKVRIKDAGDSELLPGEEISKARLRAENDRLIAEGKTPATFTPMLLGITKASLATDSFISACLLVPGNDQDPYPRFYRRAGRPAHGPQGERDYGSSDSVRYWRPSPEERSGAGCRRRSRRTCSFARYVSFSALNIESRSNSRKPFDFGLRYARSS